MMVQAIFYTIPYSLLNDSVTLDQISGRGINILIDDLQFSVAEIVNYANNAKADFIFSLSGALVNHPRFETLFQKLFGLFTMSGLAGSPVINLPVLDMERAKEDNSGLEKLESYFKSQGENLNIIAADLSTNVHNKILFLNGNDLNAFSEEQFTAYYKLDIEQVVLLHKGNVGESERGDLLFSKISIARQLAISHHQKALWQNRAQLYLSFLTLSKEIGEGEYYGIKQWYHTEYEVLPLWYKQFGHILKVLSGKRSFKSLFNKN